MLAHERACSRGDDCECMFLDHTCPFVGVELVKRNGRYELLENGFSVEASPVSQLERRVVVSHHSEFVVNAGNEQE